MTVKLWLLPKYQRKGASSRLRFYQYVPHLERAGFEVCLRPLFGDEYIDNLYSGRKASLRRILRRYLARYRAVRSTHPRDIIVIQGELFPWLPAVLERLALRGRRYSLDYDDALYHRYDMHRLWLIRVILGRKIDRLMSRAELVIAGNAYLAGRATAAGAQRVEILPTVVDLERYPEGHLHNGTYRSRIGWIGTPVTWATYGAALLDAVGNHLKGWETELLVIGASGTESKQGDLRMVPWSEDTETEMIASLSVGVMPLDDSPWSRGKCGYKLIQYLACGIPVVASPVGVNCEIVRDGENGYLAKTAEDWQQSLLKLTNDHELARRLGRRGREIVRDRYSLQSAAPNLIKMLSSLRSHEEDNEPRKEQTGHVRLTGSHQRSKANDAAFPRGVVGTV